MDGEAAKSLTFGARDRKHGTCFVECRNCLPSVMTPSKLPRYIFITDDGFKAL